MLNYLHSILHVLKSSMQLIIGLMLWPIRAFQKKGADKVTIDKGPVKFGSSFYLNWDVNRLAWIYIKNYGFYSRKRGQIEFDSNFNAQLHVIWVSGFNIHKEIFEPIVNRIQAKNVQFSNTRPRRLSTHVRLNALKINERASFDLKVTLPVKTIVRTISLYSFKLEKLPPPELTHAQ